VELVKGVEVCLGW